MQLRKILKILIYIIIKVNINRSLKANTLSALHRFDEALQYYDYAIKKNPENSDIYNYKGKY